MVACKTSEAMIQSYFYKALELGEYDETKDQIVYFIEEQSKAYRETLESAIKEHIGRSILTARLRTSKAC